jgi:hypothetical protein
LQKIKGKIQKDEGKEFHLDDNGFLCFRGRYCIPNQKNIKQEILVEAHRSKFSMHPGETKMYQDVKGYFLWNGMKKDISQFVAKCLTCQQVKAKHMCPAGLLQPLQVLQWKWEDIKMDFVIGLPRTNRQKDTI